ncbi:MAG: DUF4474 domain-containing protein, partial [Lachnospiraceae bacterium]|nr:DUF4474 domain-containing protein [Lachnospiraceae bacterium]
RAGYQPDDLHIWHSQVSMRIYQPKKKQSSSYGRLFRKWVQWQNRHNCKLYLRVTKDFSKTIDKIYYLMLAYPRVFAIITKTGRIAWEKNRP